MLTYWLNAKLSGDAPLGYHLLNLVIHAANTGLVFLVLSRLFALFGGMQPRTMRIAALIGSAVFLIHPLQTESVSYVAGRSECLAAFFILAAYAVFLYRRHAAITWLETVIVLALFALGVSTKENAVSLAGVLILTDLWWPRPFSTQQLRLNWRLYAALAAGGMLALWKVWRVLATSTSAGFSLANVTWYQYAFTEARAFFTYLRLALFPVGQSLDHDYPVSHNIWQYGALYYLIAVIALIALGYAWRKRFPMACFGLFLTIILLAPTSSVVPILDPLVERRMYLPLAGLILIGCEIARRTRVRPLAGYGVLTAVLLVFYFLCFERNRLWAQPSALWAEAALAATTNTRPYANLADQLVQERRCAVAIPYLRHAEQVRPNDYYVEMAWGRILECLGRKEEALSKLLLAAQVRPTAEIYRLIGLLYGELGRPEEAGVALRKAVELAPGWELAHSSLDLWNKWISHLPEAERDRLESPLLTPPAAKH